MSSTCFNHGCCFLLVLVHHRGGNVPPRVSARMWGDKMSRCEIYAECWFYQNKIDPQSQAFELLQKYCHGDYTTCARYQFSQSLGAFYVPKGLLPNEIRRIKPVIRSLLWEPVLRILSFTRRLQIHTFTLTLQTSTWMIPGGVVLEQFVSKPRLTKLPYFALNMIAVIAAV